MERPPCQASYFRTQSHSANASAAWVVARQRLIDV